ALRLRSSLGERMARSCLRCVSHDGQALQLASIATHYITYDFGGDICPAQSGPMAHAFSRLVQFDWHFHAPDLSTPRARCARRFCARNMLLLLVSGKARKMACDCKSA